MTNRPQPRPWWKGDPSVMVCEICGCPTQGGLEGLGKHLETVHQLGETG